MRARQPLWCVRRGLLHRLRLYSRTVRHVGSLVIFPGTWCAKIIVSLVSGNETHSRQCRFLRETKSWTRSWTTAFISHNAWTAVPPNNKIQLLWFSACNNTVVEEVKLHFWQDNCMTWWNARVRLRRLKSRLSSVSTQPVFLYVQRPLGESLQLGSGSALCTVNTQLEAINCSAAMINVLNFQYAPISMWMEVSPPVIQCINHGLSGICLFSC